MSRRPPLHQRGMPLIASVLVVAALAVGVGLTTGLATAQSPSAPSPLDSNELEEKGAEIALTLEQQLHDAAIRLPLAAALGAVLAFRPRRRGSPPRSSSVVETQVVLAVVGALVMLVVGVSLARAFGIVGVASLIRYRSKINDPRDAVVMLSALAVGLASGTGHLALAIFATLFLVLLLWFVEGFERATRTFELSVKLGEKSEGLQPKIEQVLRRHDVDFELRAVSEEGSSYLVTVENDVSTSKLSKELAALAAGGKGSVEWNEAPKSQAK